LLFVASVFIEKESSIREYKNRENIKKHGRFFGYILHVKNKNI